MFQFLMKPITGLYETLKLFQFICMTRAKSEKCNWFSCNNFLQNLFILYFVNNFQFRLGNKPEIRIKFLAAHKQNVNINYTTTNKKYSGRGLRVIIVENSPFRIEMSGIFHLSTKASRFDMLRIFFFGEVSPTTVRGFFWVL